MYLDSTGFDALEFLKSCFFCVLFFRFWLLSHLPTVYGGWTGFMLSHTSNGPCVVAKWGKGKECVPKCAGHANEPPSKVSSMLDRGEASFD